MWPSWPNHSSFAEKLIRWLEKLKDQLKWPIITEITLIAEVMTAVSFHFQCKAITIIFGHQYTITNYRVVNQRLHHLCSIGQKIRNYRPQHQDSQHHDNHHQISWVSQHWMLMQRNLYQNAIEIILIRSIFRSVKNWFVTSIPADWNVWCA